jgi:peptidoglycan/xylan/chitin deacetylase (PgdA/CDA1 family)
LNYDSSIKKKKDGGYIYDAAMVTLKILEKHNVKTTFFIVAEIFDWYPNLIEKIREMGHEIGFHTYTHSKLFHKKHLLDDLKKGSKFIDEFDIKGFRAPEALIKKEYLTILKDWGFSYDSSIYREFKIFEPIDGLIEVPISTFPLFKTNETIKFPRNLTLSLIIREIPYGSGYFIGLFGSNIQWFIKRANKKNIPANLFIHTWQIKEYPKLARKIKVDRLNQVKMIPYNINRRKTFDFLCQKFEFISLIKLINKKSI